MINLASVSDKNITVSACGTCPFEARELTSVVCHIISCFRGNAQTARDVRVTGQPNGVTMKHSTRKSTLFEPIIVPRQSKISSHCVQVGSADVSRCMAAILFETWPCHENVMWSAPSVELNGGAFTKAMCGNFREVLRQDEYVNSLVRHVSSLSMCHNMCSIAIQSYSSPNLHYQSVLVVFLL